MVAFHATAFERALARQPTTERDMLAAMTDALAREVTRDAADLHTILTNPPAVQPADDSNSRSDE